MCGPLNPVSSLSLFLFLSPGVSCNASPAAPSFLLVSWVSCFFCLRWQFFLHTDAILVLSFAAKEEEDAKKMQRRSKANYYSFLSRFALVRILFGFCSDVELGYFSVEVTVVRRGRRMAVHHHQNTSENAVSLTLFMEVVEGPSKGTTYRCEVRRAHVEMKSVCVRVSCLCALCVRRRWHTHTLTERTRGRRRESIRSDNNIHHHHWFFSLLLVGMVMIMVGKRKTYLSCMYVSTEVEKLGGENGKEQLLRQGLERERATW